MPTSTSVSITDNFTSPGAPLTGIDRDVVRVRGIDPDGAIAHARGLRTVKTEGARQHGFDGNSRPGLLIPIYNLAGEHDGYMLRPHKPVVDPDTGKSRKYLFVKGTAPALSGPPAGTPEWEARTHKLREDLDTPVIVTESMLKGDSVLSHADRDVYTLAIHGTWNWGTDGAPMPALRNIPWRRKKGERVVKRRLVVLVPDSDYATKWEVAFAWWTLGDMLRDKNADVRIFHLPTAPDGSKLGPDDALAQGIVTVAQMIEDAVPLPNVLPSRLDLSKPQDDKDMEIARLKADNARKDALISALVHVAVSPDLNRAQAIPGIRALVTAHYKLSQGKADDAGRAPLSSREIANDWRTAEEPDIDYNPTDGSRPFMQCSRVKSQMEKLRDTGAISLETREVLRPRPGAIPYKDTEYLVRVDDLPSALIQLADYRKPERKKPTAPTPCKHCGGFHGKTVITVCGTDDDRGCGAITRKEIPVQPFETLDTLKTLDISTSANFEEIENEDTGSDSSSPLTNCLQTLKRQEPDAPIVTRCDYHIGGGETCGDPTEEWDTGYGSHHLCEHHALQHRRRATA